MTDVVNARAHLCECGRILRVKEVRATAMGTFLVYHRCGCGWISWIKRLWGGMKCL